MGGQPDMSIVAEHSLAKHVRVQPTRSNGRARLTVSDDGRWVRLTRPEVEFQSESGCGSIVTVPFAPRCKLAGILVQSELYDRKAGNGLKVLRVESDDAEAEMQGRGADDQIRKIDAGAPRHLLTMDSPGHSRYL